MTVTVRAYPVTVTIMPALQQAQVNVASYPFSLPRTVALELAQVNIAALNVAPNVLPSLDVAQVEVAGYIPGAQVVIPLPTAQVNVAAYTVSPSTPVMVNLPVAEITISAYILQPEVIVGLATGQITIVAYSPQTLSSSGIIVTAYPVTAQIVIEDVIGGSGVPGFIKITYPTIDGTLLYSISGVVQLDAYGNALAVGYQGPVSAFQPLVSTPTSTESWHALSLVPGEASASGNAANGFWYRYKSNGGVELIWDINVTNTGGAYIGVLPPGYSPTVQQNIASGWYGTAHSTYQSNFQPHLNIWGAQDPLPGAIWTYGGNVEPLGFFGHAEYAVDPL